MSLSRGLLLAVALALGACVEDVELVADVPDAAAVPISDAAAVILDASVDDPP